MRCVSETSSAVAQSAVTYTKYDSSIYTRNYIYIYILYNNIIYIVLFRMSNFVTSAHTKAMYNMYIAICTRWRYRYIYIYIYITVYPTNIIYDILYRFETNAPISISPKFCTRFRCALHDFIYFRTIHYIYTCRTTMTDTSESVLYYIVSALFE